MILDQLEVPLGHGIQSDAIALFSIPTSSSLTNEVDILTFYVCPSSSQPQTTAADNSKPLQLLLISLYFNLTTFNFPTLQR